MSTLATKITESLWRHNSLKPNDHYGRYLKRRNLCPWLLGWKVMQVSRTCSKCLICLAALLSPIQALQGTPILCHIVRSCVVANDASTGQFTCVQHPPGKLTSSRTACGKRDDCGFALIVMSPSSPRKCPPNCWCLRPATPQSEPMLSLRDKVTDELASVARDNAAAGNEILPAPYAETSRIPSAKSAQLVCALLCRFLT